MSIYLENYEPEQPCFECGAPTDYRTGNTYCCHKCRYEFRADDDYPDDEKPGTSLREWEMWG